MKRGLLIGLVVAGMLMVGAVVGVFLPSAAAAVADEAIDNVPAVREARQAVVGMAVVRGTADVTGQTIPAVVDALETGKSPAQVAAENGSSGEAIIENVRTRAEDLLALAVLDGKITQERADELVERTVTQATELVDDTELGERIVTARETHMFRLLVRSTANQTDLRIVEIAQELRAGQTLGAIIDAQGVERSAVIDTALVRMEQFLQLGLDRGLLTQEELDQIIAECAETSERLLDEPRTR